MTINRQPQIPAGVTSQAPLARAPRTDVVEAVTAPAVKAPLGNTPPPKKRTVTFTNRLDPDLLDWMEAYKQRTKMPITAQLDEAVRDFIKKTTGESL